MLELLVALIILGLVLTALGISLRTALGASARARRMADQLQEVRVVFAAIERDLRAAYLLPRPETEAGPSNTSTPRRQIEPGGSNSPGDASPPGNVNAPAPETTVGPEEEEPPTTWFVGGRENIGQPSAGARLSFTALSHRLSALRQRMEEPLPGPQADLCAVEYALGADETTGKFGLIRRERVPPQVSARKGIQEELVSDRVMDLRFRYYDGQTWQDTWNTDQGASQLPGAVEITLVFRHPGSGEMQVYTTSVTLACQVGPDDAISPAANAPPPGNTPAANAPSSGNTPAP